MKQTLLCAALMAGIAASNLHVPAFSALPARIQSALDDAYSHTKLAHVLAQAQEAAGQ